MARVGSSARTGSLSRSLSGALLVVAVATSASLARASGVEECIAGAERAQLLRDHGKFREARASFRSCTADTCPAVVRADCVRWSDELRELMPSIVPRVQLDGRSDVADVRVLVDGELTATLLDGRPIEIDPGLHAIRVERAGSAPVTMSVLVREGEKRRGVDVALFSTSPIKPEAGPWSPSMSPLPWIFGGVSLASFGTFTFLAVGLQRDVDRLRDSCAPACAPSDVDAARTKTIVTNTFFAVGVASLAAAAWLWLSPHH